jgi:hypothetical protein
MMIFVSRTKVLSFVDGSFFARDFLSDVYRSRLRSFVRPVDAVHVTAGLDEVRMPGPDQKIGL